MIAYPKIPSAAGFPHTHCTAFVKYDGSNVGVEWTRKRGFTKFRLRKRLFDVSDAEFGPAIPHFMEKWSEPLAKALVDSKMFTGDHRVVVFGEFYGPHTFAGNHYGLTEEQKAARRFVPFDIYKDNVGFLCPKDFLAVAGHLDVAKPVYEGKFNGEFCEKVRKGGYRHQGVYEGVIVKGGKTGSVAFAKVKTYEYQEKLKQVFSGGWKDFWE